MWTSTVDGIATGAASDSDGWVTKYGSIPNSRATVMPPIHASPPSGPVLPKPSPTTQRRMVRRSSNVTLVRPRVTAPSSTLVVL